MNVWQLKTKLLQSYYNVTVYVYVSPLARKPLSNRLWSYDLTIELCALLLEHARYTTYFNL